MQVWQCVQDLECVYRSLLLSTHNKWAGLRLKTSGTVQTFSGPDGSVSTAVSISIQILKIFDILTSGWSLGLTIYTPLRCLGWKVKFWRWMAKIKMNVTFLNEILFWMNGTELVLRICTSYSWPVTILQMICTAPSISDNSQQSTRKYKICPHIKSTSPKQHSDIFYSPSTTETIKLRFGNIYIKFKFVCWGCCCGWCLPSFVKLLLRTVG